MPNIHIIAWNLISGGVEYVDEEDNCHVRFRVGQNTVEFKAETFEMEGRGSEDSFVCLYGFNRNISRVL